jgi:hypothetical protein
MSANMAFPVAVLLWVGGGLLLEVTSNNAHLVLVCGTWALLAGVALNSHHQQRREIAYCLLLATLGELVLIHWAQLYDYLRGPLPGYIPPGHALVYLAAVVLARQLQFWIIGIASIALVIPAALASLTSGDIVSALCGVLVLFLLATSERRLYVVIFSLGLLVEFYGTAMGAWEYHPTNALGMRSGNPPLMIGAIYCMLTGMVRACACRGLVRCLIRRRMATERRGSAATL